MTKWSSLKKVDHQYNQPYFYCTVKDVFERLRVKFFGEANDDWFTIQQRC